MHEDRVILDSVLAQNRDAILGLHNLIGSGNTSHKELTAPCEPLREGEHYKNFSESTGIDTVSIADVLPPSDDNDTAHQPESGKDDFSNPLRQTFSKRGVRLSVHMLVLNLNAHKAPEELRKKWIQEATGRGPADQHDGGAATSPTLSRISEVDSVPTVSSSITPSLSQPDVVPSNKFAEMSLNSAMTPTRDISAPPNTPQEVATTDSEVRKSGSKFQEVVKKLSVPVLRSSPCTS